MQKYIPILILQLITILPLYSQYSIVSGKVTNEDNIALPSVYIKLEGVQISTISNKDGFFTLKVPNNYCENKLSFSHVGYAPLLTQLVCGSIDNKVVLNEVIVKLDAIEITDITAKAIVLECIKKLEQNYQLESVNYTFFSREIQRVEGEPIALEEAVYYVYHEKSPKPEFSIQKIRAKSFNKLGKKELNDSRLMGIYATESNIMLRYLPAYLKKGKMNKFKYETIEETNTDFVIRITSDNHYITSALLHVNKEDYGISYLRSEWRDEEWNNALKSSTYKESYYSKENGKWYFTHGESGHVWMYKKKNQAPIKRKRITVVTNRTTQRAFPKEEKMPHINMVKMLDQFTGKFDDKFWENYNVVPLEEDFRQALEQVK